MRQECEEGNVIGNNVQERDERMKLEWGRELISSHTEEGEDENGGLKIKDS